MKQQYIRFFEHADSIPANSEKLIGRYNLPMDWEDWEILGGQIENWMNKHPAGKVDFVWL